MIRLAAVKQSRPQRASRPVMALAEVLTSDSPITLLDHLVSEMPQPLAYDIQQDDIMKRQAFLVGLR